MLHYKNFESTVISLSKCKNKKHIGEGIRMYLLATPEKSNFEEQLESKIDMELFRLGFPPDLKGFNYIRDSIIILIKDPDMIYGITKNIYPLIAERSSTKPSVVERAIRISIKAAWDKSGENTLYNFFSHYSERPTNRTVLAFLCKYINAELGSNRHLVWQS